MVTLLTGAGSGLGRRVAASLHDDTVVELEPSETGAAPADRLVHLAAGDHDGLASRRMNAVDITQRVLDTATSSGVDHVVLLSSAMVYGAWPNNPVPLTEDAPLRPDPGFAFVEQVAQVEQMADAWRTSAPGRRVAVLRPALALAADGTSSVVRALAAGLGTRIDEDDPPAQFLHLDDLASAVVLAHEQRLDGVFNVAADGWIPGETVRALAGRPPRLRLPSWLAEPVADIRWRFQRGPIPPGLRPYARHPWLVASDRLRALGWVPTTTNEQAYVEGTEAKWWTMLTPKRKQELSLAAMSLASLAALVTLVLTIRRARSRLKSSS
jgi:nucleoside-diphosphate-sugar epimerase